MTASKKYAGPMQDIKVIDFGHYYAGPMAAMMMADQGADVIHIVKPGPSELIEPQFRLLNRNKKILTLDLKSEEDKQEALSLIENADVLIENFRPGVMKRLGLDYASVKALNPGLIYLSLPGFASTDKERSHIQAWEGVIAASVGLFTAPSWWRSMLNYPPIYYWMPQCSVYGALHGMVAVLAALIAREKQGLGTVIEAPLAETALSGLALAMPQNPDIEPQVPEHLKHIEYSSQDSEAVQAEKHIAGMDAATHTPFTHFYRCADDRKIHINSGYNPKFIKNTLTVMGLYTELLREGYLNESPLVFGLDNDMAHNDQLDPERTEYLIKRFAEVFITKPSYEWEALLSEKATLSIVRTREEWLALPEMHESGVLTQMDNGKSVLSVPAPLADIANEETGLLDITAREPETIDLQQAKALFGTSSNKTVRPNTDQPALKKGDLLKGLKVLDLCNVVAGPASTYNLAQYGAEIIKADPPGHTHYFPAQLEFMEITQGKRCILTEVKTAPGREVFHRLVQWADVVAHNSLDNVCYRLGITQPQLQAINPNVTSCQISAFGGVYRGGWELRPGNDSIAQAPVGMMAQYGSLENPQIVGGFAATDMMGGLSLAITILLNVLQKQRTGKGGEGRTSLARALCYTQLPYVIAENGRSDWGEPHGQFTQGLDWWRRIYSCEDGWIYLDTGEARAQELAELITGDRQGDEKALIAAFAGKNTQDSLDLLREADIACHRVMTLRDIALQQECIEENNTQDLTVAESDATMIRRMSHPCGQPKLYMNPKWVRVGEEQGYFRQSVGPKPGEHTREILAELGYDEATIETLISQGICHEFLPALGSKDLYFFTEEQMQ